MRKFLIPILMAGAMMPVTAMAADRDRQGARSEHRAERAESKSDSDSNASERAERPQRAERAERPQRAEQRQLERAQSGEPRFQRRERRVEQVQQVQQVEQVQPTETRQVQVRRQRDNFLGGIREVARQEQTGETRNSNRDGYRDGRRDGYDRSRRWSSHWRTDNRYDWRHHRDRHRSIFRLGRYYDPYGWGYRRFSIGFNIGSSYYGSNYWLDDPWMYRLPPAYGPYRWVRYYDDALLVNIYSGQVVDVIHNFFW